MGANLQESQARRIELSGVEPAAAAGRCGIMVDGVATVGRAEEHLISAH